MTLDRILLGLLRQPSSGYEIKEWFNRAFHHFWAAESSQIYRTLSRLNDSGLTTVTEEASAKGPPKRVYSITPAGRRALSAWLSDGPCMSDTRQSHLAQVLFLAELPAAERDAFLSSLRDEYTSRLEALREIARHVPDQADPRRANDDEEFFRRLTLDAGVQQYESWIRWINKARSWHQERTHASHTQEQHSNRKRDL